MMAGTEARPTIIMIIGGAAVPGRVQMFLIQGVRMT